MRSPFFRHALSGCRRRGGGGGGWDDFSNLVELSLVFMGGPAPPYREFLVRGGVRGFPDAKIRFNPTVRDARFPSILTGMTRLLGMSLAGQIADKGHRRKELRGMTQDHRSSRFDQSALARMGSFFGNDFGIYPAMFVIINMVLEPEINPKEP